MRREQGHKRHKVLSLFCVLCAFLWLILFLGAQSSRQVEWLYYGRDQAGTKYSPLTDINQNNVQRLEIAWQWKHWETPLSEYRTTPGFFEATPLMINGVLYVTTPYNSIAAVDAETGKELWRGKIPYENTAVPMTYRTRSGRQFVVVATGARADKRAGGFCAECQVTTSAG